MQTHLRLEWRRLSNSDIQYFDRWINKVKESSADAFITATRCGAVKSETAVAWIGVSADGALLYALNNSDDQLYILETRGRPQRRPREGLATIRCRRSSRKDGKTLYVANLGDASVAIVDVSESRSPKVASRSRPIPIPNDIVVTRDNRLFVSCGHTNNVISVRSRDRPAFSRWSAGYGPQGAGRQHAELARPVQETGRFYVANPDNNSVAVIDVRIAARASARLYPCPSAATSSRTSREAEIAAAARSCRDPQRRSPPPVVVGIGDVKRPVILGQGERVRRAAGRRLGPRAG